MIVFRWLYLSNLFNKPIIDWRIKCHAKKDGKIGIPNGDSLENYPFAQELELIQEQKINSANFRWEKNREKLENKYKKKKITLKNREEELTKAKNDFPEEAKDLIYHRKKFNIFYWLFIVLLAIAEFPLNRLCFEIFMAHEPAGVLVMAFGVSIAFVACGHFLGVIWRRKDYYQLKYYVFHKTLVIILLVLSVILLGLLAIMRGLFFKEPPEIYKEYDFYTLDDKLIYVGTITFFFMNLIFFISTTIFSWMSHEHSSLSYYQTKMSCLKLEIEKLQIQMELLYTKLDKIALFFEKDKEYIQKEMLRRLYLYLEHNYRVRYSKSSNDIHFGGGEKFEK